MLHEIDGDLMAAYEAYLKAHGVGLNTISFYMRILRAVYNRAVEKGLTHQQYPFKHVFSGEEEFEERGAVVPQKENGAAAFYRMGRVYAADRGEVSRQQFSLFVAYYFTKRRE